MFVCNGGSSSSTLITRIISQVVAAAGVVFTLRWPRYIIITAATKSRKCESYHVCVLYIYLHSDNETETQRLL